MFSPKLSKNSQAAPKVAAKPRPVKCRGGNGGNNLGVARDARIREEIRSQYTQ